MKKIYILYLFLIIPGGIFNYGLFSQNLSPNTWTEYCGWHYGASNPPWAGWVREHAKDGFGLNIANPVTFELNETALNASFNKLAALDTTIDILQLSGGLGSARDTANVKDWMNFIEADSAKKWKNLVYNQSLKLTELVNSEDRVYWQLGNEITSHTYSSTIRYWNGETYAPGTPYDQYTIPYYVENFFAPTAEAIDSASKAAFGTTGRIKICLGSITNAGGTGAQNYTDALLNYQIVGTNAPALAGKYVYELVNIITVHYIMGNASTTTWEERFGYYTNWIGTGRISGVWSTEEVGIKAADGNSGAFVGSVTTSRYLELGIRNQLPARTVRTNYYGWNNGDQATTVNTFNDTLVNFLGDVKLMSIPNESTIVAASEPYEYHGFSTEDGNKSLLITFYERSVGQIKTEFNSIAFCHKDWGTIVNAKVYKYLETGMQQVNFTFDRLLDTTQIIFEANDSIDYREGLVVMLENGLRVTVNNGSGSGLYLPVNTVTIEANSPPTNHEFAYWSGDTWALDDSTLASPAILINLGDITLNANYSEISVPKYELKVIGGTGSGNYEEGEIVNISADEAPLGKEFDKWAGDISLLTSVTANVTSFTMPANIVNLTATYRDLPPATYTVTIINGTGSGNYIEGETINILADDAPLGKEFDKWTGDTAILSSTSASAASFLMPESAIELTATYKDIILIDEILAEDSNTKLFPNPANQTITISSNVIITNIQIINITGEVLMEYFPTQQNVILNISAMKQGVYFVNIIAENKSQQLLKFVKQ